MLSKLAKNPLSILSLHDDSHGVDDEPQQKPPAPPDPRADDQDRVGDEAQGAAHHHDPLQGDQMVARLESSIFGVQVKFNRVTLSVGEV